MNFSVYALPLISALAFYLIPTFVGNIVTSLRKPRNYLLSFFENFICGSVIIYCLALVIDLLIKIHVLGNNLSLIKITFFISYVLALCGIVMGVLDFIKKPKPTYKRYLIEKGIFLSLLILAAAVYFIWRFDAPIGTALNWDIYHHQVLVNQIAGNTFNLDPQKLSDTFQFGGYTTLFHTLIALPFSFFKPSVLSFWWFLEFLHLFTVILVTYTFAYVISRRRLVGLLAAIVGALAFEANGSYTSLFLIPQNLIATMGVGYLALLIADLQDSKKINYLSLVFFAAFCLLGHFIVGVFVLFLGLVVIIYTNLNLQNKHKVTWILLGTSFLLLVLLPLLSTRINLSYLNRGEAAFYTFTLVDKFTFMKQTYGFTLIIFGLLGLFFLFRNRNNW
jgi:hypothetical protein